MSRGVVIWMTVNLIHLAMNVYLLVALVKLRGEVALVKRMLKVWADYWGESPETLKAALHDVLSAAHDRRNPHPAPYHGPERRRRR